MSSTEPKLSIIVLVSGGWETVRPLLRHLHEQTVSGQCELVLVSPEALPLESIPSGFASLQQVRSSLLPSSSEARAAGVRAARGELVAFVEDHSFPLQDWAEHLMRRFESGPWTGVGPAVLNGNPGNGVSWLNYLIEYGEFAHPFPGRPVGHIPGHNSCYRREILLSLGSDLARELEAESTLQWRLGERGHQFFLEGQARVRHYNFSRLLPSLWLRFYGGWLFAANRQQKWPAWRRRLYLLASPLIPLVRAWKTWKASRRIERESVFWKNLPLALLLLGCDGLGEAMGYWTGQSGRAMEHCTNSEYQRPRYLNSRDRQLFPT